MRRLSISLVLFTVLALGACSSSVNDNAHTTATTSITPSPTQVLTVAPMPQKVLALLATTRLDRFQDLKILSPQPGEIIKSSSVPVRVSISVGTPAGVRRELAWGDHLHVLVDDLPYEEYLDLHQPLELKNLTPGEHLLRVFVVSSWHESQKIEGSLQMVKFTVSDDQTAGGAPTVKAPDLKKPLLTYNCPQGEFKGPDADPIMIDFWISNAKLKGDGGEHRIRYFIDDDEARYIDKWEPVWLKGWTPGKHTVRVELLGADQYPVKNGAYNITTREITVTR